MSERDELTRVEPRVGRRDLGDLSGELGRALNRHEFRVVYQPIVDLRDGTVVGVEALLRWQHPEWGELEPESFLRHAERSPAVVPLGCWVIEQAVEHAARWRRLLGRPLRVWVNLAASQLEAVAVLRTVLTRALEHWEVDADLIGFEVTESTLMRSIDDAVLAIRSLRELGVDIALDDFGTGYSSLAYLRRLPVTEVKIDRSFVAGMGGSLADAAIVEAVIDLAHALGHGVLAEGVEERGHATELLALGADRAQGFYFSPPVPRDELERLLDVPWCGAKAPDGARGPVDRRADRLPGAGGPRARLLLTALDSVSDAVVVFAAAPDPRDNRIVYVNPAFEAQTGLTWADVVGGDGTVLDPPGPQSPEILRLLAATRAGRPESVVLPARRADGSAYPCEITMSPVVDDKGIVTHWLALRRDLTARRALEAERARFQSIIERGSSGAVLTDLDGAISYANRAAGELCGAEPDDLLGSNIRDLYFPPLDEWSEAAVLDSVLTQGTWIGTRTVRSLSTGDLVPVEVEVQLVTERSDPSHDVYLAYLLHDRRPELRRQELRELAGRFAGRVLERPPRQSLRELQTLVRDVGQRFGASACFVDLIDQRRQVVVTEACWEGGASPSDRPEVPVDDLPAWLALLGGVDLVVLDGTETGLPPGHDERDRAFGVTSPLAQITVPLRVDGQLLGVMGVSMTGGVERQWSDDEIEFMRSLGETTANLVARHRVEEAEDRRSTYHQLAFGVAQRALDVGPAAFLADLPRGLAELGRALECHHIVAGQLDGDGFVELGAWTDPGVAVAPAPGSAGVLDSSDLAVAARGAGPAPLVLAGLGDGVADTLAGAGAGTGAGAGGTIVVPLVVAGRSIGVLAVITHHHRRRWSDDEVAVVRAVGETVAFALERRRVNEALARSEARLTALLANTADIVVVVDREGIVRYASPAVGELLGGDPEFVVGRAFTDFVHPEDGGLAQAGLANAEGDSQTGRVRLIDPYGQYHWFEARTNDRFDDQVGGLVVVLRDIEMRVAAERAAATRADLEQFTLRVSGLDLQSPEGFLDTLGDVLAEYGELLGVEYAFVDVIDADTGLLSNHAGWTAPSYSPGASVFPVPLEAIPHWLSTLSALMPVVIEDLDDPAHDTVRADIRRLGSSQALLAMPMSTEDSLIGILGVGVGSGPRQWTSDEVRTTRLIADATANAIAKARVDAALKASETRFRLLAEHAADVVMLAGPDGELRYLSPSIRELLGHEPDDLLGARLIDIAHPDDHDALRSSMESLAGGHLVSHDIRLLRRDGSWVWVANSGRAVRGGDGEFVEVRGSLRDVSERKRLEDELADRATHDPLTGLGNRALLAEWLEHRAGPDELCVLLIDLDGFKAVNDGNGHSTGDAVLRIVAARLRQATRPDDLVIRYGGDEFIVVSSQINAAGALALGDRIVASVSRPIALDGLVVHLGASVGVAVADAAGIASDRLLRAADMAMYRAKREGKGTVRLAAVRG